MGMLPPAHGVGQLADFEQVGPRQQVQGFGTGERLPPLGYFLRVGQQSFHLQQYAAVNSVKPVQNSPSTVRLPPLSE
jgi:hypothetical protein